MAQCASHTTQTKAYGRPASLKRRGQGEGARLGDQPNRIVFHPIKIYQICAGGAMWSFEISTGKIAENGHPQGSGYSGFGDAANDPAKVDERMRGPLPPGKYRIGKAYKHPKLGPICMDLAPLPGTDTFGRDLFRIHGDNKTPEPFDGSHGCLVTARETREKINASRDRILEVTA